MSQKKVSYHVIPDLDSEQIGELKHLAIDLEISVKELVKRAIVYYLYYMRKGDVKE